jgi:hypothetical protein
MPYLTTIRSMAFSRRSSSVTNNLVWGKVICRSIEHLAGPGNLAGQDLEYAPKNSQGKVTPKVSP